MNIFTLKVHKITRQEVNQLAQEYPELYLIEVNGYSKILNDNKYEYKIQIDNLRKLVEVLYYEYEYSKR